MNWSKRDPRPVEQRTDIVILFDDNAGIPLAARGTVMPNGHIFSRVPSGEYVVVASDSPWDSRWLWAYAPKGETT